VTKIRCESVAAPELLHVQHCVEVESQFVHVDVPQRSDELIVTALNKLEFLDTNWTPEGRKRVIVEAMIIRELDQEEGFLDFSSF